MNITKAKKELVGVDIFIHWTDGRAKELGDKIEKTAIDGMKLVTVSNRGVKVWPGSLEETFCVDQWICRFQSATEGGIITHEQILAQLQNIKNAGFDFIKTEGLYTFDGVAGFTLAQGQ